MYLVLVAQYESFFLPLAVILSLPIGVFGSFLSCCRVMGLSNDVYAQIGLIMLVGSARQERHPDRRVRGPAAAGGALGRWTSAVEGGRLRFRPIQMTSFAFIAGLLPLVVATGAGAIGNRTIGTTAGRRNARRGP